MFTLIHHEHPRRLRVGIERRSKMTGKVFFGARRTYRGRDDVACGHLKVGDQCQRAVALILVLPAFDQTRFHRPYRMQTLKRLHAGFFIAAHRMHSLFMAGRGQAIGLADFLDLSIKRRRILIALMVEPV